MTSCRVRRIVEALEPKDADVIVLSEFRRNAVSHELRERLREMGYTVQAAPEAEPKLNTVLIASRQEFESVTFPGQMVDEVIYPRSMRRRVRCMGIGRLRPTLSHHDPSAGFEYVEAVQEACDGGQAVGLDVGEVGAGAVAFDE